MAISLITEIELRGFSGLSSEQENWLGQFLADIHIIGIDYDIKEMAIQLRRRHRLKIPDAIIAATAMIAQATLLTNDAQLHGIDDLLCCGMAVRQQR
ncbi:MAG: PIN domain-containing protein [Magnetococcales bacterium]|nr:PIN domain-containing protein [Magnetococcales bacterium]